MYAYLFEDFLQEKKYANEVLRVESRIAQLGLQGRSIKITVLKNITEAARDAVKRGATTLIAIGSDQTISRLLPIAIESGVTLGIIPIGQPQEIARYLGVPNGVEACDVISRRIIEHLDVGKVESHYFLLQAALTAPVRVTCDNRYTVEALDAKQRIVFGNLGSDDPFGKPTDGRLELIVNPPRAGWSAWGRSYSAASVFPIARATIAHGTTVSLVLDGQTIINAPSTVEVVRKKLSVIVGRQRHFV